MAQVEITQLSDSTGAPAHGQIALVGLISKRFQRNTRYAYLERALVRERTDEYGRGD